MDLPTASSISASRPRSAARPVARLLAACVVSTLLYLVLAMGVAFKPLTVGTVMQLDTERATYLAAHPGPKVIVIAGSNGLYSFRCQVISQVIGRPCVNMSMGAQAGLEFDLARVRKVMNPGDVVVMPYEFEVYGKSATLIHGGLLNVMLTQYDRPALLTVPPAQATQALFSVDFRYVLEAFAEQFFHAIGIKGYFTATAFTPEGDYALGTAQAAAPFKTELARERMATPPATLLTAPTAAQPVFKAFFAQAKADGVTLVGTLPTTFDDAPHDAAAIARLQAFYRDGGAQFITLPNNDQYPRSCFLDSHYHLIDTCQIPHSRNFAALLQAQVISHLPHPPTAPPPTAQ